MENEKISLSDIRQKFGVHPGLENKEVISQDTLRFYLNKDCYNQKYYRIIHNALQYQYAYIYCENAKGSIEMVPCGCARDLDILWGNLKEEYDK